MQNIVLNIYTFFHYFKAMPCMAQYKVNQPPEWRGSAKTI